MKCRIRPSAFSSSGGNSCSRLNSVTSSSVRSRPRSSIARRMPWESPMRGAGMGRMAPTLTASGGAREPGGPRAPGTAQLEREPAGAPGSARGVSEVTVWPVGTAPGLSVAPAPLAVAAGARLAAAGFDGLAAAGFDAAAGLAAGLEAFAAVDVSAGGWTGFAAGFAVALVRRFAAGVEEAAGFAAFAPTGFLARRVAERFAAALRRGVARPVATGPAAGVAAAPLAAWAGVRRAVPDFGAPGSPGLGAAATTGASSCPRRREAARRPASTALRPNPAAEPITFLTGIRAVLPVTPPGLCSERAIAVRRAARHELHVAAGDRQRLGGREALPHRAAGRHSQRPRDPAGQRVEVEAQLQLVREEVLSPLPRGVHLGQDFRGRAGEEVVNKRGAGHQGGGLHVVWRGACTQSHRPPEEPHPWGADPNALEAAVRPLTGRPGGGPRAPP